MYHNGGLGFLGNAHSCAVCGDFVHDVADIAAVKTHHKDGIGSSFGGRNAQPAEGVFSAVGQELRVAFDLATEDCVERCPDIAEHISASYDDAEHFTVDFRHFVAG